MFASFKGYQEKMISGRVILFWLTIYVARVSVKILALATLFCSTNYRFNSRI